MKDYYIYIHTESKNKKIKYIQIMKNKDNRIVGWSLYKGDVVHWESDCHRSSLKNVKSILINENIYNYLLSLHPTKKLYINSTNSEVELFRYWGILDDVAEQLI